MDGQVKDSKETSIFLSLQLPFILASVFPFLRSSFKADALLSFYCCSNAVFFLLAAQFQWIYLPCSLLAKG